MAYSIHPGHLHTVDEGEKPTKTTLDAQGVPSLIRTAMKDSSIKDTSVRDLN